MAVKVTKTPEAEAKASPPSGASGTNLDVILKAIRKQKGDGVAVRADHCSRR